MSDAVQRDLFTRRVLRFAGLLASVWCVLYVADRALPFVAPGHELIYRLAQDTIREGTVFPADSNKIRVAVFGASQTQAGFLPDLFDELSDGQVYSFNFGLPATTTFIEELRTLVERGEIPDIVALTSVWESEAPPHGWELWTEDQYVVDRVFPFRRFPRDSTLFLLRSLSRGGPRAYYATARANVERARRDRGYFFIEGMSHFADHRLPDDFRLDSDPAVDLKPREFERRGPLFEELIGLREQAGFRIVYIPGYERDTLRFPESPDMEARAAIARHGIEAVGPDYLPYPNRLFSDPAHVNPDGAIRYTTDLWTLLAPIVEEFRQRRDAASA